jgi:hypothetical protein
MGMKIEQLVAEFLYQEKKVTLTDIGTFILNVDIKTPTNEDATITPPDGSITFHYNPQAPIDENLIKFIIGRTGKIRPLALSDLDSFIMLGKQFLNLGKPFTLKNIGMLLKNSQNQYEFSQDNRITLNLNQQNDLPKNEEIENGLTEPAIDFSSAAKKKSSIKGKFIIISILLLTITGLILFLIKYDPFESKSKTIISKIDANKKNTDTIGNISSHPDTTLKTIEKTDFNFYNIIIRSFKDSADATKSIKKLTKKTSDKNLILYKSTNSQFKIAVHFQFHLSDSTHILDSIKKTYGKKIYLEKK